MNCLYYLAQWEMLAIFGSLQNPDFIQILAQIFHTFLNVRAQKGILNE